jgi:protein-tyrosine phosphatase
MKLETIRKICPDNKELQSALMGGKNVVDVADWVLYPNLKQLEDAAQGERYIQMYQECLENCRKSEDPETKLRAQMIRSYFKVQSGQKLKQPETVEKVDHAFLKLVANDQDRIKSLLKACNREMLLDVETIEIARKNAVKGDQPFSYELNHEVKLSGAQRMMLVAAPTPQTIASYLEMVYEKKAPLLVTLCSPTEPDILPIWQIEVPSTSLYKIDLQKQEVKYEKGNVRIVQRTFIITKADNEPHEVHQLHYENWPDCKSAPNLEALDELFSLRDELVTDLEQAIVINCKHGIGRTAMFAVIDAARKKIVTMQREGHSLDAIEMDPAKLLNEMRKSRSILNVFAEQLMLPYQMIDRFLDQLSR